MKIIGKGADDIFICEIKKSEIANLFGFYSDYSDGFPKNELKVGSCHKVSALYSDAEELRKLQAKVREFQEYFCAMADTMRSFQLNANIGVK